MSHERQTTPSKFVPPVPRFLASPHLRNLSILRGALAAGAVTDFLRQDADGPFNHVDSKILGATRATLDIGAVARGEVWFVEWSLAMKKDTGANPSMNPQYRYFDADTGAFSNWKIIFRAVVATTDLTTSYDTFADSFIFNIPTTDFEVRI